MESRAGDDLAESDDEYEEEEEEENEEVHSHYGDAESDWEGGDEEEEEENEEVVGKTSEDRLDALMQR